MIRTHVLALAVAVSAVLPGSAYAVTQPAHDEPFVTDPAIAPSLATARLAGSPAAAALSRTLASLPIEPVWEQARTSSSSASSSSSLARARSSSRLAASRLAFASATRRARSADETSYVIPELLELWTIMVSCSTMCGIATVDEDIAGTALPRWIFVGGST